MALARRLDSLAATLTAATLAWTPPAAAVPRLAAGIEPGVPGFGTVRVEGLPRERLERLEAIGSDAAAWLEILAVSTREAKREGLPAMLGAWRVSGGALVFEPRFPLVGGLAYRVRFDGGAFDRWSGEPAAGTQSLRLEFALPVAASGAPPAITAVHPGGDEVPVNLLRFYLHFSEPMSPRSVAGRVRLLDADGWAVETAFVEVEHGLWDPEGRRLTLFLHPGRVKRGVGPRRAMGPVLEEGREYALVVDGALEDVRGVALGEDFVHRFRVGAADTTPPDVATWRLRRPATSEDPVVLELPEPLDHALLGRLVRVEDAAGRAVEGSVEVSRSGRRWSFRPASPWCPDVYSILVHPALEDLAGNSLLRRFEERGAADEAEARPIRLDFRPADASVSR